MLRNGPYKNGQHSTKIIATLVSNLTDLSRINKVSRQNPPLYYHTPPLLYGFPKVNNIPRPDGLVDPRATRVSGRRNGWLLRVPDRRHLVTS